MKRPGFTLMELLVYMGIVSIALVVFMNFMVDITRASQRSRTTKEVSQNGRFAITRMTQDIRSATSVSVTGGSLILNGGTTTYALGGNAVTLNGNPITSSTVKVTTLMFQPSGDTVTINLSLQNRDGLPPGTQKQLTLVTSAEPHKLLY